MVFGGPDERKIPADPSVTKVASPCRFVTRRSGNQSSKVIAQNTIRNQATKLADAYILPR